MKELDNKIEKFVSRVRSRLREQSVIQNLIYTSILGLLFANVVCAISLVIPFYYAVLIAVFVVFISAVAGIIKGILKTPDAQGAALKVDAMGYQEKVSTALFLRGQDNPFAMLQKKDALKVIEDFQIRKRFPIQISRKYAMIFCGLTILLMIGSCVETPARRKAMVNHEVKVEAKKEIEKLEKLEKEIKKTDVSEKEMAELTKQIETAKKELKDANSRQELEKVKERLTKKMELAAKQSENAKVRDLLQGAAKENQEQMKKEKEELAKEALDALEKAKSGSGKDKKNAYKKMEKLAAKLSDSNLQQAADEFDANDYTDASVAEAKNAVEQAMNQENQSNRQNASNSNQATTSNSSNQNGQMTAQNQNNSQNKQQNASQTGGQSGANGQNGSNGQNGAGGNGKGGGAGWNHGSKDGQEGSAKVDENITVPEGILGNDENLTGQANGNTSGIKEKSNESNAWSGNKVSYGSVSGDYKKKAYTKIQNSNYPSEMKDKIKNYFDGLN